MHYAYLKVAVCRNPLMDSHGFRRIIFPRGHSTIDYGVVALVGDIQELRPLEVHVRWKLLLLIVVVHISEGLRIRFQPFVPRTFASSQVLRGGKTFFLDPLDDGREVLQVLRDRDEGIVDAVIGLE